MPAAGEIHRAMFDAVQAHDIDALRALYHADYVYMGADGVERKGADEGVAVAQLYVNAFPDLRFELRHQYEPTPSVSIMEITARGTHQGDLEGIAPTGRHVEVVGCNIVEVQDAKVIREREYFDTASILQQLGVMEA